MLLRQITGTQDLLSFRASEVSSIDNECLNVSSEIEETLANIKPDDFTRQWGTPGSQWVKQRDDRYKLDANEQLMGAASASVWCCKRNQEKVQNLWRGTHSYVLFDYTCLC